MQGLGPRRGGPGCVNGMQGFCSRNANQRRFGGMQHPTAAVARMLRDRCDHGRDGTLPCRTVSGSGILGGADLQWAFLDLYGGGGDVGNGLEFGGAQATIYFTCFPFYPYLSPLSSLLAAIMHHHLTKHGKINVIPPTPLWLTMAQETGSHASCE